MKANFFYNQKVIGDVLLIIINNKLTMTRYETHDDVTLIYSGDELIGINIFNISEIVKFKTAGRIILPSDQLVDVVNNKIAACNVGKIDYVEKTGFTVGKILTVDEHPESDHLHILTVDIGSEVLDIVCGARNVKENMLVVVATVGTMMMDGTTIEPGKLLGEVSNGMCCSPKELGLNIEYPAHHLLVLEEDKVNVGDDFFSLQAE